MWGLVAIAIVVAIVLFFVWFGDEATEGDPAADAGPGTDEAIPGTGEQVEWRIEVGDLAPAPGVVLLKGDKPEGVFIETWKDDLMLTRSATANLFEWDMQAEIPEPVGEIDAAQGCDELNMLLADWATQTAEAFGDGQRAQAEAFAQHALNTLVAQGCEPAVQP